jgi:hypothetical protein
MYELKNGVVLEGRVRRDKVRAVWERNRIKGRNELKVRKG